MKSLKRLSVSLCLMTLCGAPVLAASTALAPYTDNPLVEFLARQRYHVVLGLQADLASNDHDALSLVAGFGYFPVSQLAVGVYGTVRNSDRLYPFRMKQMYGLGLFSEYNFAPVAAIQPFAGGRFGFIDTSGPGNPTSMHAAALGGVKIAFNKNIALSTAAVLNWTADDILDYKQSSDGTFKSSNTDIGIEVSLRFGF
jgi:hypothetical protein